MCVNSVVHLVLLHLYCFTFWLFVLIARFCLCLRLFISCLGVCVLGCALSVCSELEVLVSGSCIWFVGIVF